MSIICKTTFETLHSLELLFRKNRRAFYSRFGDGDIYIMMGRDQKLHHFCLPLQREMIESFSINSPQYLKGLAVNYPQERGMVRGILGAHRVDRELQNFLLTKFDLATQPRFESAVFLHYLALFHPSMASAFLDEFIRPKKKLFIGAVSRKQIEKLVGPVDYYVQTAERDSYSQIDHWWPEVLRLAKHVELVIPATGMSTRIINKRLWNTGLEIQSFDIGSLVDAVELLPTRKWIRLAGHRAKKILLNQPNPTLVSNLDYLQREIRLGCYSAIKWF
jgi:hypothetical protein